MIPRIVVPLAGVCYLVAAIDFARQRNWLMAGVWASYALANFMLSRVR